MKREVTQEEFQQAILEYWGISIVRFYSSWNKSCDILFPVYDAVAEMYSKEIKFFSINTETAPVLKSEFAIGQLPKIVFFRFGEIIDELNPVNSTNRALSLMLSKIENAIAAIRN